MIYVWIAPMNVFLIHVIACLHWVPAGHTNDSLWFLLSKNKKNMTRIVEKKSWVYRHGLHCIVS